MLSINLTNFFHWTFLLLVTTHLYIFFCDQFSIFVHGHYYYINSLLLTHIGMRGSYDQSTIQFDYNSKSYDMKTLKLLIIFRIDDTLRVTILHGQLIIMNMETYI